MLVLGGGTHQRMKYGIILAWYRSHSSPRKSHFSTFNTIRLPQAQSLIQILLISPGARRIDSDLLEESCFSWNINVQFIFFLSLAPTFRISVWHDKVSLAQLWLLSINRKQFLIVILYSYKVRAGHPGVRPCDMELPWQEEMILGYFP